ncbi:MAG: c-type cytochrome, partial [Pirellula staleyi]
RGPYYQPEPWSETKRIASVLQKSFESAAPEEAGALIELMQRNRIPSTDSLDRMLQLAKTNDQLLGPAIAQMTLLKNIPDGGQELLLRAVNTKDASAALLADAVVVLSISDSKESAAAVLKGISALSQLSDASDAQKKARDALVNSLAIEAQVSLFDLAAQSAEGKEGYWAESALLAIASRTNGSPEAREQAMKSIEDAWRLPGRRSRLMQVAVEIRNHYLDEKILQSVRDSDDGIAKIAKTAVEKLKIKPKKEDNSPKINSLSMEDVTANVIGMQGDIELGKQVFTRANCGACHTIRQDEVQKGPYLGSIAKTYKRPELAIAILEPSKTIAQGFVTNLIRTKEDVVLTGFVTNELTDRVTIRDQQGKETTILKEEFDERKTSPTSVMPSGVLNEFTTHELASLLDYIESLAK